MSSNPVEAGWQNVFTLTDWGITGEYQLTFNSTLPTLCMLGKEWRVTHDFKPTECITDDSTNSLHLTIKGNNDKYGDRTPTIFPSTTYGMMAISSAVNGDKNYTYNAARPPVGAWTTIAISQTLEQGKYIYRIAMGGDEVHAVENSQPQEFQYVQVHASDEWHEVQPGSIRNLEIETKVQD